jgi:hypothetical protein
MKKATPLVLALLLSFNLFAQKTKPAPADTLKATAVTAPQITDSTVVPFQVRDLDELKRYMDELPAKYANPLWDWITGRARQRILDAENKRKK